MTTSAGSSGAPSASIAQPPAIPASPAGIARDTRGEASEPAMTAMLSGAKTSPSAVCSCSTARNIAGEVGPVIASATSDPRASPGRRRAPGGRSGFGDRRWMRAKRTSMSTPPAAGRTHPWFRPRSTAARPSVKVSAPGTSSRPPTRPARDGSLAPARPRPGSTASALPVPASSAPGNTRPASAAPAGNRRPASAAPASPIGTLTANTHSQPGPLVIRPPRTQPEAPPPAAAAVQIASARERAAPAGSVATRSASAEGATSAAPLPCTARAATSAPALGASAQASDAAAKSRSPIRNARRAP
jgi:hypothetical protein